MKKIFVALVGMTIALTPVLAANWYVSPNGSDANNGTSWASAKKTIQAGINAATATDTVLVADGTYVITQQIAIATGITLKSVNGASSTILDGNYPNTTNRILFIASGLPASVADGFTIQNGYCKTPGGGVRIEYGGFIKNCIVKNNYTESSGGGVYYHHMLDQTDRGGLWNCTIVNNTAGNQGGGVQVYDIPGGTIRNCIIYFNSASSNANYGYPSVNAYGTCCTTPNTGNTAANNVYEDPQFISSGNYHLRSTSPCIGRGMFKSWMTTSIDADGKPRIINGTVDIGAYEYSEAPIASIQASPTSGTIPLTVQFRGTDSAASSGRRIVVYEWDFDSNGIYEQVSQNGLASWTYSVASTNIVTLRVTDDIGVKGTASTTILANPNPVPPPVVSLNANPASGDRPLSVILTASATSERTIASYLWDFNGDGVDDLSTQGNSVTNIYSSVGVFQARVTAIDDLRLSGRGQTNIQVAEPSNLKVWLSSPKDSNHVWGNCVTLQGHAVPASKAASFQFQYKASSATVWLNLGDIVYPTPHAFSFEWDVTTLVDQANYDLRGKATDTSGETAYSDPITVTVDSGCRHNVGGIVEEISDGIHSKSQTFSKDEEAVLALLETTATVPIGTVESNITVQVRITGTNTNPINGAALGKYCINQNRQVSIEGNPELTMPITVIMPYPMKIMTVLLTEQAFVKLRYPSIGLMYPMGLGSVVYPSKLILGKIILNVLFIT